MIQISDTERRRAFSVWLRTGRWPTVTPSGGVEVKFNPWHDPADGRFTFAGSGRAYGRSDGNGASSGGRSGSGGSLAARSAGAPQSRTPEDRHKPRAVPGPNSQSKISRPAATSPRTAKPNPNLKNGSTGAGFTGGGGGRFGGGGASSREPWINDPEKQLQVSDSTIAAGKQQTAESKTRLEERSGFSNSAPQMHSEVRNGYEYQIDDKGRTRNVSGALVLAGKQVRSRTAQAQAGGVERKPTDDGGHYVAARFNGPTEAFNHFAQNANFNRGGYRVLEDEWARDKRTGRTVTVRIVPQFDGGSVRPSVIDVWWRVDGKEKSAKFPNRQSERNRGK
ncbi:DNA/RNA non-specific endonuclease [Sphingomonas sp. PvP056]|uniref:DNA/RNA non-specific endonuclease n=1 Tax=Sphingomonas sp. PvP056 TaxID=3156392 RepID=UPI00339B6AB8